MEISLPTRYSARFHWTWTRRPSVIRAVQGFVLGIGAPLGWFLVQLASLHQIRASLSGNLGVYLYMLIGTCAVFAGFGFYAGLQEEQVAALVSHDDLTGLYNCRHFWERLDGELSAATMRNTATSLLLINIDYFKRINEDYGHIFGNRILNTLGTTLRAAGLPGETVARIAGQEFCIILPNSDWRAAGSAALRYQDAIRNTDIRMLGIERVPVTASIGIATNAAGNEIAATDFLHHADSAMRLAKANGRDRIEPTHILVV